MEQDVKKREAQQINVCRASSFPAFIEDTEDELKDGEFEVPLEEKIETPLNKDDKPLEEGNRIWATGLFSEAEQIWATASISQRLAEGFQQPLKNTSHHISNIFTLSSPRIPSTLMNCLRRSLGIMQLS